MKHCALVAAIVLVGCASGGGDEEGTSPPKDATAESAIDSATPPSDALFPLEDTSSEDTEAVVDTELADTEPGVDTEMPPMTSTLTVNTTECKPIYCPSTHPYVVGCSITMGGASSQGCAVHITGGTSVTFKEGQSCGDITVAGTLTCSTAPGSGLNATNCTMNKPLSLYRTTIGACPT